MDQYVTHLQVTGDVGSSKNTGGSGKENGKYREEILLESVENSVIGEEI